MKNELPILAPGASENQGTRQPRCVVVFVPGSMQAVFDQSTEMIARQIASGCNKKLGRNDYATSEVDELRITASRRVERCTIEHRQDTGQDIVFVSANYREFLSEQLEGSGVTMRFLRLLGFWLRYSPLVLAILRMPPRPGHTFLTIPQKAFVIGSYCLATFALVSAIAATLSLFGVDLLKIGPWKVALGVVILAGLLPSGFLTSSRSVGQEYYGLVRYLLKSERQAEISNFLDAVYAEIERVFPSVPVHVVAFSFGCVVCVDHLFPSIPKRGFPFSFESLSLIGFPYILVDACRPGYFFGRKWHEGVVRRWQNLFLKSDILGSTICRYLPVIFDCDAPVPNHVQFTETAVVPQRTSRADWNPILTHLTYWDPASSVPCDAVMHVVHAIFNDT